MHYSVGENAAGLRQREACCLIQNMYNTEIRKGDASSNITPLFYCEPSRDLVIYACPWKTLKSNGALL